MRISGISPVIPVFITGLPAIVLSFLMFRAPFLPSPGKAFSLLGLFVAIPVITAYSLRKEKTRAAVVAVIALVLFSFLIFEISLRIAMGPVQRGMPSINSSDRSFWYFKPDTVGVRLKEKHRINSWGFRGNEPRQAQPGVLKVLVIGDSIPFGGGIPEEDIFPLQAEMLINKEKAPHTTVEVINASFPAYSLEQIKRFYIKKLHDLSYDIVILIFYIDDINRELRYKKWNTLYTPTWPEWIQDLFYTTHTMNRLLTAIGFKDTTFLSTRKKSYAKAWNGIFKVLNEISAESVRKNARFAVFNIPRFNWNGVINQKMLYKYWKNNVELESWCRDHGIPYRDSLSVFLNRDIDEIRMNRYGIHLNKTGHHVVGNELRVFIEELIDEKTRLNGSPSVN
ncbi:MAG: SGNH/GDSL hydrolase family protein [Candidatus Omnitrophica bacterium]|nr:SGNH/GDSL hydrolase family protein [Candidatus Omnitrophota bacterium]